MILYDIFILLCSTFILIFTYALMVASKFSFYHHPSISLHPLFFTFHVRHAFRTAMLSDDVLYASTSDGYLIKSGAIIITCYGQRQCIHSVLQSMWLWWAETVYSFCIAIDVLLVLPCVSIEILFSFICILLVLSCLHIYPDFLHISSHHFSIPLYASHGMLTLSLLSLAFYLSLSISRFLPLVS